MDERMLTPVMFINAVNHRKLTTGNLVGDDLLVNTMRSIYHPRPPIGDARVRLVTRSDSVFSIRDTGDGRAVANYMALIDVFISMSHPNIRYDMARKLLQDVFNESPEHVETHGLSVDQRKVLVEGFDFVFGWIAYAANSEFLRSRTTH